MVKRAWILLLLTGVWLTACSRQGAARADVSRVVSTAAIVRFAVIGDFGVAGPPAQAVTDMVHGWQPDFILTVGDNAYDPDTPQGIQNEVLRYYGEDIAAHRFFPTLGNHDWDDGDIHLYLRYLAPPEGRRYYTFVWGPVQVFVLDSDYHEPDGIDAHSPQAHWLQAGLAASGAAWKLVALHHPPYSSGQRHGSTPALQWPYAAWGADAVFAGHDHEYERIVREGIVYFVDGLGGVPHPYHFRPTPVAGSVVRYRDNYGALQVEASAQRITFRFITVDGQMVDTYTLHK